MNTRRSLAVALAFTLVSGTLPASLWAGAQQATVSLRGTAREQAKKPYEDYSARARNVQQGQIAGTMALDMFGNFSITGLPAASYLVELVDRNGKIVCTEGPFDMTRQAVRDNVTISCSKVPAAWWLLGAAAAAGITAGIVATGPASGSQ